MTDSSNNGKLFLVGIGPGGEAHMTARAREAMAAADTLIDHATYLRLVAGLVRVQQVVKSTMTEEVK